MFATGFLLGTIVGAAAGVVLVVLDRVVAEVEAGHAVLRPTLVPLHVSGVRRESLN